MKFYYLIIFSFLISSPVSYGESVILTRDKAVFRLQNKVYFFSNIKETLKAVRKYDCLVPKNKITPLFFDNRSNPLKTFDDVPKEELSKKQLSMVRNVLRFLKLEIYSWRQTKAGLVFNKKNKRCPYKEVSLERLKTFAAVDEFLQKKFKGKKISQKDIDGLMVLVNRKIKHYAFF